MENIQPKSFWKKPEGTTGAIVLAIGLVGGGYLLWVMLPTLILLLQNTIYAIILGVILLGLIYIILDKKVRTLVWYLYKMAMRAVTGLIIQLDPIKILESYIENLRAARDKMNDHITELSQEIRKLKNVIDKNKSEMENNLSMASEAKKRKNNPQAALSVKQAERLKDSNSRLLPLLSKLENVNSVLKRVYESAGYLLQDTENEVDTKKREYSALKAGHSAFKSAMSIIKGDPDKLEIFNQAMDFVNDDISAKVGEMERFMELSMDALKSVDLQNAVFEEKGFKLLEEWEKNSSILNESGSSASSTFKEKYSDLFS
ncbi:MAG TPA: hypothetical protein P5136_00960 [Methanofastidiosum sp.]|nr:hypothetical protein [Methanofastidiosum sp.]